jgi:hypothetical protein
VEVSGMKLNTNCTQEELERYKVAYDEATDAHISAMAQLELRSLRPDCPSDERKANREIMGELIADLALLRAKRKAFHTTQAAINPPTDAQLNRLKGLSADVDKLLTDRRIIKEAIQLAGNAFATFNEIQS